ncbi:hypothetical protein Droror1_Dr00021674 [Drosera rotundifolia]
MGFLLLRFLQGKASAFLLSITPVRGEKAKNKELWPNLDRDNSPDAILSTLKDKVDEERNLYIATDERDKSFFDPVKHKKKRFAIRTWKQSTLSESAQGNEALQRLRAFCVLLLL